MDIETIKQLRDSTGLSFNEIKKALDKAGGDKVKAMEELRMRGSTVALKKASRATGQGVIEAYVHSDKKIGVLVEVLCETDFVARSPVFHELAHEIAMHIAAMDPQDGPELLAQPYVRDPGLTIEQFVVQYIAKLGENIKIGQFCRLVI